MSDQQASAPITPAAPVPPAPVARVRFTAEPEIRERRPQRETGPSLSVRRTGLIPLCIGASRMVVCSDGVKRQFEARELRVEAARAVADGRKLTVACRCFECRRIYPTFEDFQADHTMGSEDMRREDIAHTWAWWCEDKYDAKGLETIKSLEAEVKALRAANADCVGKIAALNDYEKILKERARMETVSKALEEAEKKLKFEQENIIGLLSETPFAS